MAAYQCRERRKQIMKFLAILFLVAVAFYLSGCGLFKTKNETVIASSLSHVVNDSANLTRNDSIRAKVNRETNILSNETGRFNMTAYFKPNTPTTFNPDGSITGSVDSTKTMGQINKKAVANSRTNLDISAGSKTDAKQGQKDETLQGSFHGETENKPPNLMFVVVVVAALLLLIFVILKSR